MSWDNNYQEPADDSYDYEGRSNRRANREPSGPKKATAGTATAILIAAAIIGFVGGAIASNAGGGEDGPPVDATTSTPVSSTESPEDSAEDEPGNGDEDGEDPGDSDLELTLTSDQDGGEVVNNDNGRISVSATLSPAVADVILKIERSIDDKAWEPFCEQCSKVTSSSGQFESNFWSGRAGENSFRLVGEDPDGGQIVSNVITVTVVAPDNESEE